MTSPVPLTPPSAVTLYQSSDGQIQLEVSLDQDTVWLTQRQMALLFETSTDNVSLHLKNMYAEAELDEQATTEDSSAVQSDGQRKVRRKIIWMPFYREGKAVLRGIQDYAHIWMFVASRRRSLIEHFVLLKTKA